MWVVGRGSWVLCHLPHRPISPAEPQACCEQFGKATSSASFHTIPTTAKTARKVADKASTVWLGALGANHEREMNDFPIFHPLPTIPPHADFIGPMMRFPPPVSRKCKGLPVRWLILRPAFRHNLSNDSEQIPLLYSRRSSLWSPLTLSALSFEFSPCLPPLILASPHPKLPVPDRASTQKQSPQQRLRLPGEYISYLLGSGSGVFACPHPCAP